MTPKIPTSGSLEDWKQFRLDVLTMTEGSLREGLLALAETQIDEISDLEGPSTAFLERMHDDEDERLIIRNGTTIAVT